MKSYFDSQMRILQEDATLFAKQYPEHARQLNIESLHDKDPNVERLLEGFAYLTGRIEQQLDNGFMGLSEAVLESISPNALRSTPSKAIAQFKVSEALSENHYLKVSNTLLLSSLALGNDKTPCHFCIEDDDFIYPLRLDAITQQGLDTFNYNVTFKLSVLDVPITFFMQTLKFYFNGGTESRLAWFYGLLEASEDAFLSYEGKHYEIKIQHPYLNETYQNEKDVFGIEILKDFFTFRDKFMFVELIDLPNIEWSGNAEFELSFTLKSPLPSSSLNKDHVLLGCLPIENRYHYYAEPLSYTGLEHATPLVIDASRRNSICLQKIINITPQEKSDPPLTYVPFSHYKNSNNKQVIYYRVERQRALSEVHRVLFSEISLDKPQSLSVFVEVCNGIYPRKYLGAQGLFIGRKDGLTPLNATNITKPTPYFPAIDKQKYYWRLLGMLSENYQNLSDLKAFLEVLHSHDLQQSYQVKINAIQSTTLKSKQRFNKGVLYLGIEYIITLDDIPFSNKKEIYMFGTVLHYFLLKHVEINHFLVTKMECVHQPLTYLWQSDKGKVSRW